MNLIQLEKIDTTNEYGGTVSLIHANFGFFKLKPRDLTITHPRFIIPFNR